MKFDLGKFALIAMLLLVCASSVYAELNSDQRKQIITEANREEWKYIPYKKGGDYKPGKKEKVGLDCSHFVHCVYLVAEKDLPYLNSEGITESDLYAEVKEPENGDLIYFPACKETLNGKEIKSDAHIGIIVDVKKMRFIGQQSKGVAQASYDKKAYWGKRTYKFYKLK